jgi:hypothetical protein
MKLQMWSYISGSMSLFFIIWTVSKVGVYHKFYVERTIRFEEARFLTQSDACTDPIRRAVLSDLCMEKQRVLYTKPWLGAVFDTADALSIPYSQNLPKIIISLLILALVVLLASGIQIRRNKEHNDANYWRLPIGEHQHVD